MNKLLMISGFGATRLAKGEQGAFYYTLQEFHKHWDRIDVIAPGRKWWFAQAQDVKLFDNVFIHTSPWPLWLQPQWIVKKGVQIIRAQQPDRMTVQESPPFYNGMGARRLHKVTSLPYMLEVHHIEGYPRAANIKERIYRWLTKRYIARDARDAQIVRVVNKTQVPTFLQQAGVPQEKITYIPSMYIDTDVFKPQSIEKKYDVIFVGRLAKNKGILLLLEAVRQLSQIRDTKYKILMVGVGPELQRIKKYIKQYKLEQNITLHGWAKDNNEVAHLMNQSRCLVMPSYNEGGPRVTLEAMACGIPVISTKVGVMIDSIEDRQTGLFVNWNAHDIADKINLVLKDQALQQRLAAAGHTLAQQFERKAMIQNYAQALQKHNVS